MIETGLFDVDTLSSVVAESSSSVVTPMNTMIISETEQWVQPLASVLGPFLNIFSFAMVSFLFHAFLFCCTNQFFFFVAHFMLLSHWCM